MNLDLVQKICHAFGKTLEETMKDSEYKYPAMVYPESLLPYPKKVIEWALILWEQKAGGEGELETANTMASARAYLGRFIPDAEAFKKTEKITCNKKYLENIFKASVEETEHGYRVHDLDD